MVRTTDQIPSKFHPGYKICRLFLQNKDHAKDSADVGIAGNPFEVNHVPLRRQQFKSRSKRPLKIFLKLKPKVSEVLSLDHDFSWAMLAVVINHKTSLLGYLLRSMFNLNMMKLTKRDEAGVYNFHFASSICVFINLSVFIYLLQKHYGGQEGIKIWLLCFAAVCGLFNRRHSFMWLLGGLFPVTKKALFIATSSLF